jgi:hypothetical protein
MRASMHREFGGYSDQKLIDAAAEALEKAHKAPKAISGNEEAPIINSTADSHARFGDEWSRIREEMRIRGMLPCPK